MAVGNSEIRQLDGDEVRHVEDPVHIVPVNNREIGTGPLEEAYYFTIEDPKAKDASIQSLLDRYVFNPEQGDQLNVDDDPDLPFLL